MADRNLLSKEERERDAAEPEGRFQVIVGVPIVVIQTEPPISPSPPPPPPPQSPVRGGYPTRVILILILVGTCAQVLGHHIVENWDTISDTCGKYCQGAWDYVKKRWT